MLSPWFSWRAEQLVRSERRRGSLERDKVAAREWLGVRVRVYLAGLVALESDGVVIDDARFPGRQGRLLFAYLVAAQGRPVPRDELAEALWGDTPPPTWDKALTILVSKLRGLL